MTNDLTQTTVTDRDRRLVDRYLGVFLLASIKVFAIADYMRRAAEEMVSVAREEGRKEASRAWVEYLGDMNVIHLEDPARAE